MDLPKPVFHGGLAAMALEIAPRKTTRLDRVEPSDRGQRAEAETWRPPDQARPEARPGSRGGRDLEAIRRDMERRALPPGPPPAFEMSLLELEADLKALIARIEADRGHDRDAPAVRPAPDGAPDRPDSASDAADPAPGTGPDTPQKPG